LMEMSVTAGTNYLIRIGGWAAGEQGTGTLEITLSGAPNPENCTNGTDDDGDGDVDCEDTIVTRILLASLPRRTAPMEPMMTAMASQTATILTARRIPPARLLRAVLPTRLSM